MLNCIIHVDQSPLLMNFWLPRWRCILFFLLIGIGFQLHAQVESDERALINVKDGINFRKDSSFLLNLRFRMQNRLGVRTNSLDDPGIDRIEARVRRLRLRLDGFVLNKNIQYYIQLSFSRADQDLETGTIAQIVRDAILYYTFNDHFYIGFGQSKLPGNRQRVVSSGNLQFADRSILNAAYNIDRDFGVFAYYNQNLNKQWFNIKTALTSGEGRNALISDNGIAYTGRIEWLPLGRFRNNGDFSEGDLEFEPTPKVSLAATYSYNHKSQRAGGQLGPILPANRSITTVIIDGLLKYRGFALSAEYIQKSADNPLFEEFPNLFNVYVPVGRGYSTQVSFVNRNMHELAFRAAMVSPDQRILNFEPLRYEYLLGYTKYLNTHRIKIQGNVGFNQVPNPVSINPGIKSQWVAFFQIEFGI
jgi:phosphate-selective porin OprO/OprP